MLYLVRPKNCKYDVSLKKYYRLINSIKKLKVPINGLFELSKCPLPTNWRKGPGILMDEKELGDFLNLLHKKRYWFRSECGRIPYDRLQD